MSDYLYMLAHFIGGIGLFLLGMKLLTDGLKVAAGERLRSLLANYTATPAKGIFSGMLITAMVQSSSAVIFATIGFVNAGLMKLLHAAYVVLGSNVGTTFTGWIVAFAGFEVNLQLLSMPILAIGMALWLSGGNAPYGAIGQALVGFGIFFLGIDILKSTFDGLGDAIPFESLGGGWLDAALIFLTGIVLTSVMQSSSATIAVVITAAGSGVIPVEAAAVMVIGADIGTTSTALFAAIGASPGAKRTAMVHVVFNLAKVPLALPFIGLYLSMIYAVLGSGLSVGITIAVFHTLIKIIGMVVLLPFTRRFTRFLEYRFVKAPASGEQPRYLDESITSTPTMAVSALIYELKRTNRKTRRLSLKCLAPDAKTEPLRQQQEALSELSMQLSHYIKLIQRNDLPDQLSNLLPEILRVVQYLNEVHSQSLQALEIRQQHRNLPEGLKEHLHTLEELLRSFMVKADSKTEDFSLEQLRRFVNHLDSEYENTKRSLLRSSSEGELSTGDMIVIHDMIRSYRRIWDQLMKATSFIADFDAYLEEHSDPAAEVSEPRVQARDAESSR